MNPEYKTNLTEQQYRSYEGRVLSFARLLSDKIKNKEITLKIARDKIMEYAESLGILTKYDNQIKHERIISAGEIFGWKLKELQKTPKDIEITVPKQFVTVVERNVPCQIVNKPNVKQLMLGTVDYADKVRREAYYSICETPKGIKVSSPAFGSLNAVSRRSEKTRNKCPNEFGKDSKEIGEFHTHPGEDSAAQMFSMTDLLSFSDDPFNFSNSNCVVYKKKDKKGKQKIVARCTSGVDAKRYLRTIQSKEDIPDQETLINRVEERFVRDPDIQNAFSCTVNLNNNKKPKLSKNQYDGKILPQKSEKITKNISEEAKSVFKSQKKKLKVKSESTDEGFMGLGKWF